MAFRDDSDALRARVESLERELEEAREKLSALEGVEEERAELEARVTELEGQLGLKSEAAKKEERKEAIRAKARRQEEDVLRQAMRQSTGAWLSATTMQQRFLAVAIVSLFLGLVGWLLWRPTGMLAASRPPSIGVVDLDATPTPTPIRASATGTSSAGFDCPGHIPESPQLVLRSRATHFVRIAPVAESGDLVMVLVTPDGRTLCDDDGGGSLNPLITTTLPPGDSRLFIGTYGSDTTVGFTLMLSATVQTVTPDATGLAASAAPSIAELSASTTDAQLISYPGTVTAAWTSAQTIGSSCRGYLPLTPHLVVHLAAESTFLLEAAGGEDLVMLMRGPDGTVTCDDDSGASNDPRIASVLGPGEYRIWVGTYSQADPTHVAPFTLMGRVESLSARPRAAQTIELVPEDGTALRLTGTTAGEVSARTLGPAECPGLVPARAQIGLRLAATHDVSLSVFSPGALPTVLVRHPDGLLECVGAVSRATWQPGEHQVFVGVPDDATPAPFVLGVLASPPSVQPWTP